MRRSSGRCVEVGDDVQAPEVGDRFVLGEVTASAARFFHRMGQPKQPCFFAPYAWRIAGPE